MASGSNSINYIRFRTISYIWKTLFENEIHGAGVRPPRRRGWLYLTPPYVQRNINTVAVAVLSISTYIIILYIIIMIRDKFHISQNDDAILLIGFVLH